MIAPMQRAERRGKPHRWRKADSAIGVLVCGIAAAGACAIAAGHSWEGVVPLVFSAVLLAVSLIFGAQAGLIGTVLATLVFAAFLFSPLGSVRVTNEAARANLGWMLLIGMGFSFLFAPPKSGFRDH